MSRRPFVLALLLLAACGGGEGGAPGRLGVGAGAVPDPTGRADYLLDLGVAVVGGQSRAVWTLANDGDEPLEATIGPVPLPFALEGEPVRTVPAGSRTELFFAFRPAAGGAAEAIVEFASPRGSHRVRLIGTGTQAALRCEPANGYDFGLVVPGETKQTTITCTNGGALDETIDIGPMHGGRAGAFRWDLPEQGATRVLAAGESLPIGIEFRPTEPGEYAVTFQVDRTYGGDQVASILLVGFSE